MGLCIISWNWLIQLWIGNIFHPTQASTQIRDIDFGIFITFVHIVKIGICDEVELPTIHTRYWHEITHTYPHKTYLNEIETSGGRLLWVSIKHGHISGKRCSLYLGTNSILFNSSFNTFYLLRANTLVCGHSYVWPYDNSYFGWTGFHLTPKCIGSNENCYGISWQLRLNLSE